MVFATGYDYRFPFLPSDLQVKSGYRLRLYKHVFPPTLARPTLAVIGFIHGFGAINPLSEMQARWATRVFKGKVQHRLSFRPRKKMIFNGGRYLTMHKTKFWQCNVLVCTSLPNPPKLLKCTLMLHLTLKPKSEACF